MKADAKLTAVELLKKIKAGGKTAASIRSPELAKRIKEEPADATSYEVAPGELDPRTGVRGNGERAAEGLRRRLRLGPSFLFPHRDARRRSDEVSRDARLRRDRQFDLLCHRRGRCAQDRPRGAVRGRRQPVDAHPGAGGGAPARHQGADGDRQRRRLRRRDPQAAPRRHRRDRRDLRPARTSRRSPKASACAARPSPTSSSSRG